MKKLLSTLGVLSLALVFMGSGCFSLGGSSDTGPARTGPGGMFVSTDKGETWTSISRLPRADGVKSLQSMNVYRLYQDPTDEDAMYWSASGRGMFYTYDSGRTWMQPPAVTAGVVRDISVHPKDRCTLYITQGKTIRRSTDCSRHFETVFKYEQGGIVAVTVDPFRPSRVTAATSKGVILQTTNAGVSWDRIATFNNNPSVRRMFYDPYNEDVMYMATARKGLYISNDNGDTWKRKYDPLEQFTGAREFRRLYIHPSKANTLFWISTYGVLRSDDRGDSWKPYQLVTLPGVAQVNSFVVNKENDLEMYYVAEVGLKGSLYYSSDGGETWTTKKLPSDQIPTWLHLHPNDQSQLYLGYSIPAQE